MGVCLYNFLETQFFISRMKKLISTLQNKYEDYTMSKKKKPQKAKEMKKTEEQEAILYI